MVSGNIYEEDFRKGKYDEKAVICFINGLRVWVIFLVMNS